MFQCLSNWELLFAAFGFLRFVRVVGMSLFVSGCQVMVETDIDRHLQVINPRPRQSRGDAKAEFYDFFKEATVKLMAKLSLWQEPFRSDIFLKQFFSTHLDI